MAIKENVINDFVIPEKSLFCLLQKCDFIRNPISCYTKETKWDSGSIFFRLLKKQPKRKLSGMTVFVVMLFLILGLWPSASFAETCKDEPGLVGDCYAAHGRLRFYNGTPSARIWLFREKRMLGIHDDKLPSTIVPYADMNTEITGDFLVCPFTQQKPHTMQMVCVQDVAHMDLHHRD